MSRWDPSSSTGMTQVHLGAGWVKEGDRPVSNKDDGLNHSRQLLIHRALVLTWSLEPKMPHGTPTPTRG